MHWQSSSAFAHAYKHVFARQCYGDLKAQMQESMDHTAPDWIVEEWLCRYVAHCMPIGGPQQLVATPLSMVVDTLEEAYRRAGEAMESARELFEERLMWIEIETLDRAGQWNAVRRYYPHSFR